MSMNVDVVRNMKGAAVELLLAAGVTGEVIKNISPRARITEIMHNALTHSKKEILTGTKIAEIRDKYGLTTDQLSNIFLAEMSDAGRTLAVGSAAQKQLMANLATEHKLLERMELGDETFQRALEMYEKFPGKARQLFKNIDKMRLGLMTLQTATTARNTANATARTFLFALDNLGHGVLDMATAGLKRGPEARQTALAEGARRATSGMRLFNSMTWNQTEANVLKLVFADEMPRTFKRLYMQNADVGAGMGFGKGAANFSRKLNLLNTISDNAFKRAVFMSELQTLVGQKKLRQLIAEGNFASIDKKTIAKAMNEAMSFTYQKSYRGLDGRQTKASNFLEMMSTPATTWLIPFPKFIANSVEFMWTHAPILGMVGKAGTKEKLAKQVTGMGMLYGAIQLRAQQGPDARWWQWYNEETGEYENALAFYGPFAPFMLAADLILRSNLRNKKMGNVPFVIGEKTRDNWTRVSQDPIYEAMFKDWREKMAQVKKAVFGTTFRTGTGLEIVDALWQDVEGSMEKGNYSNAGRALATFGGNYLNTFAVGMGEVRDIYGLVDPEYRVIQNPEVAVHPLELFVTKATRSLPISLATEDEQGRFFGMIKGSEGMRLGTPLTSPTTTDLLRRERSGRKQITGRGTVSFKNVVEKALEFHEIPKWRAFPRLAEPELNEMAKKLYNEYTKKELIPIVTSNNYITQPETPEGGTRQKLILNRALRLGKEGVYNTLSHIIEQKLDTLEVREKGNTKDGKKAKKQLLYLFQLRLKRLPEAQQDIAKEQFLSRHNRSPSSWEDYKELYSRAKKIK